MVCGATAGATSATYPPRGLVDATKVDAIVDEMVVAIPQSNVSTRWMQPTWKQLCRSCSYTICARAFDRDGHFDVINSAKGGKYAKSSQLAKLAENKRFRYSGALLMQKYELTLYRSANSYMKQLRDCSLFAKSLDFRVI